MGTGAASERTARYPCLSVDGARRPVRVGGFTASPFWLSQMGGTCQRYWDQPIRSVTGDLLFASYRHPIWLAAIGFRNGRIVPISPPTFGDRRLAID